MLPEEFKRRGQVITDDQRQLIAFTNYVILCGIISMFGCLANIINMLIFHRQGLNTTINISFFSLAVSDLCGLILQQMYNIYINPLFLDLDLPIVYNDFQYITTGVNREMFARITCLITAFITAERCLGVVYPLHVKRIVTPKITSTLIIAIFTGTLLSAYPIFLTSYYTWKFNPASNRTLLGISVTSNHGTAEAIVYLLHGVFTSLGFLLVVVFTLILIYSLKQKRVWRKTVNIDESKSASKRDRAAVTMVVLIAGILVLCYTPAVILCLATFLEPEFSINGNYHNLCYSLWSFAILLENINSSVNIFLYYKMSSKYRQIFRDTFFRHFQWNKNVTASDIAIM